MLEVYHRVRWGDGPVTEMQVHFCILIVTSFIDCVGRRPQDSSRLRNREVTNDFIYENSEQWGLFLELVTNLYSVRPTTNIASRSDSLSNNIHLCIG
jgi:hypothetical protein